VGVLIFACKERLDYISHNEKVLPRKNDLAYFPAASMTKKKTSLITLSAAEPEVCLPGVEAEGVRDRDGEAEQPD